MAKKDALATVEDYRELCAKIMAEELQYTEAGNVRDNIRRLLQDNVFDVVVAALGLSRRWGRWEIDHTNGNRNKAADVMLAEAKGAAEAWLKEQAGKLPVLNKQMISALHKEYQEALRYRLSEMLREKAHEDARKQLAEMFGDA